MQNKDRSISFFETDVFNTFSLIFGLLPIFDWSPVPIDIPKFAYRYYNKVIWLSW